jgi:hypothetical protein
MRQLIREAIKEKVLQHIRKRYVGMTLHADDGCTMIVDISYHEKYDGLVVTVHYREPTQYCPDETTVKEAVEDIEKLYGVRIAFVTT